MDTSLFDEFTAMMDKATGNGGHLRPDVLPENHRRFWYDYDSSQAHVFNKAMLAWADACFDDMTSEPCDDSDDGFNKTSSARDTPQCQVPVVFDPDFHHYLCVPTGENEEYQVRDVPIFSHYLGITYKVGDTTTFGPGPYDESLGVPVTVHFRG